MKNKSDTCFWCGEFLDGDFCNNCANEEKANNFIDFLKDKAKEHGAKEVTVKIVPEKSNKIRRSVRKTKRLSD